jgi:hypothetical protein
MSMSIMYTLFTYLILIGYFLLWIAVAAPYVGSGREQLLAQSSKKIENDTAKFIFHSLERFTPAAALRGERIEARGLLAPI